VAQGSRDQVGRLPRLKATSQSPTLRAGTGRDHGSFTSARPIHHKSPRVITVREAARLHGFPDWFGFNATRWHGFREVGNSVPPLLAQAVASAVVEVSGREPKRRSNVIDLGSDKLLRMTLAEAAEHFGLPATQLPKDVRRPLTVQMGASDSLGDVRELPDHSPSGTTRPTLK
jgi:DNA (cytosine-5)-methyltransferase 1